MGKFSQRLQKKVMTRGKTHGYCTICREYGKLTREHVVPQGCGNIEDKVIVRVTEYLDAPDKPKGNRSQGGIHFRTVCAKCNSLLGSKYDRELINFSNDIAKHLNHLTFGHVFNKITYRPYRTLKLAKAVVGHLLAANSVEETNSDKPLSNRYSMLSEFVLNEAAPLPEGFDIYYWLYPYKPIKMLRSIGSMNIINPSFRVAGDILKYYPIAFLVSYNSKPAPEYGLTKLNLPSTQKINDTAGVEVSYMRALRSDFPERPEDYEVLLMNDEVCTVAV
ncbi:HNH endonuclease [Pseudoalteromonas sp. L21]|uniref:HNH endonuclease n=1 Tax=Pseudoalteromonas sp. L21 TaxID=1539746 RepID=UPI001F3A2BFF|nr:HNH endonuclease [Pseudoalteromonas sp. L21]MCF7519842.1 HNH endonuclease [Pseudoalteromonas sp. L21]